MATNLTKAADDARRLLRGFKAFAEVADALEAAGQAELRQAEAEKLLAELQPQIEAAKANVARLKDAGFEAVANAERRAIEIQAKATSVAVHLEAAAEEAAKKTQAAADEALTKRQAEMTTAAAARDAALVKRDALLAECDVLETRLAKAKGSIAKLLG